MAKRFTDTEKWDNAWFRKMHPTYRWFWVYLCDSCDHAGIWRVDFETAAYYIGEEVTKEVALVVFGDRIVQVSDDKWFIPSFVKFQYGELNEASKPHRSIIKKLVEHNICPTSLVLLKSNSESLIPLAKGIHTLKDKEQDKDKDKEQKKTKKISKPFQVHSFEELCEAIGQEYLERLNEIYPVELMDEELEQMVLWLTATPENAKADYKAFARNWLKKAAEARDRAAKASKPYNSMGVA